MDIQTGSGTEQILKALDQAEEEVEEKLVDKQCEEETVNADPKKTRKRYPFVIPYIKVVLEWLRRTLRKYEVSTYFKTSNTLRQLVV